MLTLIGLAVFGVAGTGVAAKLGLVDVEKNFEVLGYNIHVEFSKEKPIEFKVD